MVMAIAMVFLMVMDGRDGDDDDDDDGNVGVFYAAPASHKYFKISSVVSPCCAKAICQAHCVRASR